MTYSSSARSARTPPPRQEVHWPDETADGVLPATSASAPRSYRPQLDDRLVVEDELSLVERGFELLSKSGPPCPSHAPVDAIVPEPPHVRPGRPSHVGAAPRRMCPRVRAGEPTDAWTDTAIPSPATGARGPRHPLGDQLPSRGEGPRRSRANESPPSRLRYRYGAGTREGGARPR